MTKAAEQPGQSPAKVTDATPSMEEILQSIRGVISGDETNPEDDILELTEVIGENNTAADDATPSNTVEAEPAVTQEKSILDDIDEALDTATPEPKPEPVAAAPVQEETPLPQVEKPAAEPQFVAQPVAESPAKADDNFDAEAPIADLTTEEDQDEATTTKHHNSDRLLGEKAAKQSSGALKELVSNIPDKHVHSPASRSGTSLEDLVIEAMKPFLADWLNKNLPVIVKKIVEKEVKRLIPKEDDD